jgi:hypothetical protein
MTIMKKARIRRISIIERGRPERVYHRAERGVGKGVRKTKERAPLGEGARQEIDERTKGKLVWPGAFRARS